MTAPTRREGPSRASLGGVVSKLATDLAAVRAELESTRALLARREREMAAAETEHAASLRVVQVLTRETEALAEVRGRFESTLGMLHAALREQNAIRARQHKALAAADADRAWLLDLVDRVLRQQAVIERRASPASALARSLWGNAELPVPGSHTLPPRGRALLLLALGLSDDEIRGVVALAMKDASPEVTPVLATDAERVAGDLTLVPIPRQENLRRLPAGVTAEAYLRERVICLCRRLVPRRVVAFGPLATGLLAELRAAGEQLELTAPETDPSGHIPTADGPS